MSSTRPYGAPYRLKGKRLAFLSWYYVDPERGLDWSVDGARVRVMSDYDKDDPRVRWAPGRSNYGVRLSLKPARRSGPLFENDKPWDRRGMVATILHDGGKYRAWGATGWHYNKGEEHFLCYLESEDGIHFVKPELGLYDYRGDRRNNILTDRVWQFHPGGIFIDESAPESERYKWINEEDFTREEALEYLAEHPDEVDAGALVKNYVRDDGVAGDLYVGARGAVSPDGLRWTFLKKPLVITHTDTNPTCYYDAALQKYVAYFRDYPCGPQAVQGEPRRWGGWRRAVGRSESGDFTHFPLPEIALCAPGDMNPNEVLYTNCRTSLPGAPDHHLMFPAVWDTGADTTWLTAASSHDGRYWQYIPGGRLLDTGVHGAWDGGYVFAYPDLLELPDGAFALPYVGLDVPHKYPRERCVRNTGYALWDKGRMACVEAAEYGEFSTVAVIPQADCLRINAVTRRAGYVRVQVCDGDGRPVAGRGFEDCDPLFGDCFRRPVSWRGETRLGVPENGPVVLRFQMFRAELYYLDFER